MSKVWFITGASRGFGRAFAAAALGRGDQVAATARSVDTLADLVEAYGDAVLALKLDVTDKVQVGSAAAATLARFGRIDVAVNNAGYGLFGAVEELSEQAVRDQMETNFFGALWVSQAVLPAMREQGSGHLVQISSIGGVAAFPSLGGYHASKWALEAMSESLAGEVASSGIKVTIVEPGAFETDWGGSSAVHSQPLPAYDGLRSAMASRPRQPGADPEAAARALLEVVDAEAPPLRVLFGSGPVELVKGIYQQRLDTWAQWVHVSHAAQG
jgi:NAD(P)-dependent dehydrogenase (short-subunit alcohol dehydrogenase family)